MLIETAEQAQFWVDDLIGRRFIQKINMMGPDADAPEVFGPCWLWTGAVNDRGYGVFRCGPGELIRAHVWAFQHRYGEIPPGWEVDHRCHDLNLCIGGVACLHRRCVNPEHLRMVTRQENNDRSNSPTAINARKTHCDPAGHPLSGDNVYVHPQRGTRHCRACQVRRSREAARITRDAERMVRKIRNGPGRDLERMGSAAGMAVPPALAVRSGTVVGAGRV